MQHCHSGGQAWGITAVSGPPTPDGLNVPLSAAGDHHGRTVTRLKCKAFSVEPAMSMHRQEIATGVRMRRVLQLCGWCRLPSHGERTHGDVEQMILFRCHRILYLVGNFPARGGWVRCCGAGTRRV
jgi:hypothetical protein